MIPVTIQIASFLLVIAIGIFLGAFFDIYRVLRSFWKPKKIGTVMGDAIFTIITTVLVFAMLIFGNWGEIRGYVFMAIILGLLCYFHLISSKARRIIYKSLRFISRVIFRLIYLLMWPFKVLYKIVMVPICLTTSFLHQGIRVFKKIVKGFLKVINKNTNKVINKIIKSKIPPQ